MPHKAGMVTIGLVLSFPTFGAIQEWWAWTDQALLGVSQRLVTQAELLDAWLAPNFQERLENHSYLKFSMSGQVHDYHGGQFDPSIKVRLHLPQTRQAWHRYFQKQLSDDGQKGRSSGFFSRLGLDGHYLFQHWDSSLKLGMRLQLPLDPFANLEVSRIESVAQHWRGQFKQRFFYFYQYGGGAVTELNFFRQNAQNDTHLWKWSNRVEYLFDKEEWTYFPSLEWYRAINNRNTLIYGVGVQTRLSSYRLDGYWVAMTWKHRVYKDRVFFSLRPEILFSHEHDYRPNVGLFGQISFFFSRNAKINPLFFSMPYCNHLDD